MTALHELTGQFLELASNEDLPAEAIRDTLEAMEGDIKSKAASLADWSLDMDGNIEKIDAAIERLQEKKKTIVKRKESLIEYLRNNMEACEIKKITCPLFSITLVNDRESVGTSDETLIPDEYMSVKTEIKPDKAAIYKALKEGAEIPGAFLQKGQASIRIK